MLNDGASKKDISRFVLSKGQSNLALMAVLAKIGMIDETELFSFAKFDSRISMQADRTKFPGVLETSAGSLGHGFPMAVGMAWAKKIKKEGGRILCLAGDGEMNEGTMWEALLFAASERLSNLTLIIDNNHSIEEMIDMNGLKEKLDAFGFCCVTVDGHDVNKLKTALRYSEDIPVAIIAETKRGWGSRTLMDDRSWFHRFPNDAELEMLLGEVETF